MPSAPIRYVALTLIALFLISSGGSCRSGDELTLAANQFSADLAEVDRRLLEGQSTTVAIACPSESSVMIVPSYESEANLKKILKGCDDHLIDAIYATSNSDRTSPALVWIRGGRLLGSQRIAAEVAMDLTPLLIDSVRGKATLIVEKRNVGNEWPDLRFLDPKKVRGATQGSNSGDELP